MNIKRNKYAVIQRMDGIWRIQYISDCRNDAMGRAKEIKEDSAHSWVNVLIIKYNVVGEVM